MYCGAIELTFLCRIVNSVERLLTELVQNENVTNLHVSTPNLAFGGERVSDSVHIRTNVHTYSVDCLHVHDNEPCFYFIGKPTRCANFWKNVQIYQWRKW